MPVALESVVLAELVDEVTTEYGPVATEMGRSVRVAMDADLPPVLADRALLKRVLVNLVANSLRHGGSADVCIEAACEPTGSPVAIRVVDHGRGIATDELGRVFEKFMSLRGDPAADTGLGLPFCKLAIERMNGTIDLSSTPGVYTTKPTGIEMGIEICRSIVEAHGGRMWVAPGESRPGAMTMRLTIPLAAPPDSSRPRAGSRRAR